MILSIFFYLLWVMSQEIPKRLLKEITSHWKQAMEEEIKVLEHNQTWHLQEFQGS